MTLQTTLIGRVIRSCLDFLMEAYDCALVWLQAKQNPITAAPQNNTAYHTGPVLVFHTPISKPAKANSDNRHSGAFCLRTNAMTDLPQTTTLGASRGSETGSPRMTARRP